MEQWERGRQKDVGWIGLGGVKGKISRRAKVGMKGARKGFYFSHVIHGNFSSQ